MYRVVSLTLVALASLPVLSGCQTGPPPPPTFKVEGKVVEKDGKPYTGGGQISFNSVKNPQNSTVGLIANDGSFTLKTVVGTQGVDGAQEGEHTVTIVAGGDGKNPRPILLKTPYMIKAEAVNTIVVNLE